MSNRTCTVEGCSNPPRSTKMCKMHQLRVWRHGSTELPPRKPRRSGYHIKTPREAAPTATRFWAHVDKTSTCWLWQGSLNKGYGRFQIGRAGSPTVWAHRWAYENLVGEIPPGLHLDHLCRVPNCVNPAHLEPVTPAENNARGMSPSATNARKTHCVHGHEFTPENTYRYSAGRGCRICRDESARRYRERRRAMRFVAEADAIQAERRKQC